MSFASIANKEKFGEIMWLKFKNTFSFEISQFLIMAIVSN